MARADRTCATLRPTALPLALLLALVLAVLAGCTGASGGEDSTGSPAGTGSTATTPGASISSYAALGDSFAAAPYVPVTDFAGGCLRSSGNYPALLAARLDAVLTDVTCSGAETADVAGRQVVAFGAARLAPQVAALNPSTDLVTLSIGGNDRQVFSALVQGCTALAQRAGTPCADRLARTYGDPAAVVAATGRRVTAALGLISRAAPDARVVLVGYPRLVNPQRTCSRFPLAPGDLPVVAKLERALDSALRGAARRAGVTYVGLRAASRGHEVCSDDPWVNGRVTDTQRALAFHPFAAEQEAVAALVADAVLGAATTGASPVEESP